MELKLELSVTFLWSRSGRRWFPGPRQWSLGSVCTQTARSLEASCLRQGGRPPGGNVGVFRCCRVCLWYLSSSSLTISSRMAWVLASFSFSLSSSSSAPFPSVSSMTSSAPIRPLCTPSQKQMHSHLLCAVFSFMLFWSLCFGVIWGNFSGLMWLCKKYLFFKKRYETALLHSHLAAL